MSDQERGEILKLDWNEAAIPPAPEVAEAVLNLAAKQDIFNLYPAVYNKELLNALSNYTGLPAENLQYFASSDYLHEYIAEVFINIGDPVLILWPSYDNFRLTAEGAGSKIYYSELEPDFNFNFRKFEADLQKIFPSLVYICNPNNLTGTLIEPELIEKLLNNFPDTLFLIDEAYGEFAGSSVNDLVLSHDNLMVSHTMSKAFALAGFRFGYLAADYKIINDISKVRNPKNITAFAQAACLAALSNTEYMFNYVREVKAAREFFINFINLNLNNNLKAYTSHGNFVLIKCESSFIKNKILAGLEAENIFVRNISLENCFRVTVGIKAQMQRVASAIQKILEA